MLHEYVLRCFLFITFVLKITSLYYAPPIHPNHYKAQQAMEIGLVVRLWCSVRPRTTQISRLPKDPARAWEDLKVAPAGDGKWNALLRP